MFPYSPTSNLPWMPPRVPSQTSCSLLETTPKTKQWKIPQTYCCWTISCSRNNPPITTPSKKKSLLPCNAHCLGKLLCARTQLRNWVFRLKHVSFKVSPYAPLSEGQLSQLPWWRKESRKEQPERKHSVSLRMMKRETICIRGCYCLALHMKEPTVEKRSQKFSQGEKVQPGTFFSLPCCYLLHVVYAWFDTFSSVCWYLFLIFG